MDVKAAGLDEQVGAGEDVWFGWMLLAAVNVWVTKWGPESQWSLKSQLVLEMAMGRHRRRHDVWLRPTGGDQMCMHVMFFVW